MTKLVPLLLCGLCGACAAQTPANNLMPDGSRDLYAGLGALYHPAYDGAERHRKVLLPAVQFQWSNGVFLAGQTLGMHLSQRPDLEYGPLLAYDVGRNNAGTSPFLTDLKMDSFSAANSDVLVISSESQPQVQVQTQQIRGVPAPAPAPASTPGTINVYLAPTPTAPGPRNRLNGMRTIAPRVLVGGFINYYLNSNLRLTNSITYGSGNDSHGMRWAIELQQCMPELAPHHSLSLSIGTTVANRAYTVSSFGVTTHESYFSGNAPYAPGGGIKDVHAAIHWNWALSNAWLVSSGVNASVLTGGAAKSPLVERRASLGASSALAYRF